MNAIIFPDLLAPKLIEMINAGNVGVLLTDTLYGIVARADNEQSQQPVVAPLKPVPSSPRRL